MLERFSELEKYYIKGLLPFMVLFLILFNIPISELNKLYISLGYLWPYAVKTPGITLKTDRKRYKYSFLRFVVYLDIFIGRFTEKLKHGEFIGRSLSPLLFCTILFLLSFEGLPLLTILGSLILFLVERLTKNRVALNNQTGSSHEESDHE